MEKWLDKIDYIGREICVYHRKFSSLQQLSILFILIGGVSWLFSRLTIFLAYILSILCTIAFSYLLVSAKSNFKFLEVFYLYYKSHPLLFEKLNIIYKWLQFTIKEQSDEFFEIEESEIKTDEFKDAVDPDEVASEATDSELTTNGNMVIKVTPKRANSNNGTELAIPKKADLNTSWEEEISLLCRLISQDFILPWYQEFQPKKDNFHEKIISNGFSKLCRQLAVIDTYKLCQDCLLYYREYLNNFQMAKLMFRAQPRRKTSLKRESTGNQIITAYRQMETVEEAFEIKFTYHHAVYEPENEINYIKSLVQLLLDKLYEGEVQQCRTMCHVLVELLSCNVFLPLIELLSDSDFLHECIIKIMSDEELIIVPDSVTATETCGNHDNQQKPCTNYQKENEIVTDENEEIDLDIHVKSGEKSKSSDIDPSVQTSKIETSLDQSGESITKAETFHEHKTCKSGSFAQCPTDGTSLPYAQNGTHNSGEVTFTSLPLSVLGPAKPVKQPPNQEVSIQEEGHTETDVIPRNMENSDKNEAENNSTNFYLESFEDIPTPVLNSPSLTFQKISIINTETATESRSTTQYTLYEVEYNALYLLETGNLTQRTRTVKRRFREFVNLQSRLDDNSSYRVSLKDVKGPKKLLSLPFLNMDKASIENRKKLLNSFLKSLIQKEDICNGPELKEFLAYDGDAHIAFVGKVPRIEKMVKTVSEVFDKIGDIPRIASNFQLNFSVRKDTATSPATTVATNRDGESGKDYDNIPLEFCFIKGEVLQLEKCLVKYQEDFEDDNMTCESQPIPRLTDQSAVEDEKKQSDISLAESVLDVAVQSLQETDCWLCRDRVISLVKRLTGTVLTRWLQVEIDDLSSADMCAVYLKLLRETMWPDGKFCPPSKIKSDKQKLVTKLQAKRCLEKFFPDFIQRLIDNSDYTFGIDEVLDSLQYEKLNKHFIFTMLDMVIERVFPEIVTAEVKEQLIPG